jgi:hypothetical protein
VGLLVGSVVGAEVGLLVGSGEGCLVGSVVGAEVGLLVGSGKSCLVGAVVGMEAAMLCGVNGPCVTDTSIGASVLERVASTVGRGVLGGRVAIVGGGVLGGGVSTTEVTVGANVGKTVLPFPGLVCVDVMDAGSAEGLDDTASLREELVQEEAQNGPCVEDDGLPLKVQPEFTKISAALL